MKPEDSISKYFYLISHITLEANILPEKNQQAYRQNQDPSK